MCERRIPGFVRQAAVVQLQIEIVVTLSVLFQNLKRVGNWLKRKNKSVFKMLIQMQHKKADVGSNVKNAIAVFEFDTMLAIDVAFKLAVQRCEVATGRIKDIDPVG